MRIVVDTNVFVSGVFFTGPPYTILDAWRRSTVQITVSPDILDEYRRVGAELAEQFSPVNLQPTLDLLAAAAIAVRSRPLPEQVCRDPDDDKFLACAIAGKAKYISCRPFHPAGSCPSGFGRVKGRKRGSACAASRTAATAAR
jgi:uncharacterized protein